MKTLADLLPGAALSADLALTPIAAVTADSRNVQRGSAFFAIPGHKGDGLDFVADAAARGAVVVVAQRTAECALPFVVVPDVRAALAHAAARMFPGQPQTVAAVTGTSGKTSVVAFLRQIWTALGHEAASLGTVGVVAKKDTLYGSLTTPGPVELHRNLALLADQRVTHLAMEASSLGIEQRRLDGVRLAAGAFTNFSRDHLDHHADMEAYFQAKMRLFDPMLAPGQPAVVDADGDYADRVIDLCRKRGLDVLTVGARGEAIRIVEARPHALATSLRLSCRNVEYVVELPLAGAFQTSNALVAAGLALATGGEPSKIFSALAGLHGAPGRLELAGQKSGAPVFIDYAHKPDALDKVLDTLRPLAKGKLVVVFGCGGDRDKGKRPLMGEIAARKADVAIVTDDNPRSEQAPDIRAAILEGARSAGGGAQIHEIGDRRAAIRAGVAMLAQGDILVVAGKGHETGQIVGAETLPFSDHEAVAAALKDEPT